MKIEKSIGPTKVICDVHKIGQVIRNLLSNAIKFTPKNKKIVVSTEFGDLPIGPRQLDNNRVPALIVTIADQGVGLPDDELDTIFDKFIQSSKTKNGAGGTGLGLAICREIMNTHNGEIWAENNKDGGSSFSFGLPIIQNID